MPIIFACPRVPILQNRVYNGYQAARNAPTGELEICLEGGFAHNTKFDPQLMQYDDQYDNSVPSDRFNAYYDRIADHLASLYDLSCGPVIDIGCGKGTFLKRMADRYEFRGLGIDPSYDGPERVGNLHFIPEKFHSGQTQTIPSLIVCRHTLEHIPNPTSFLTAILDELPAHSEIPIFCEVPNLAWIIDNGCWWDFCYEHVNYFTSSSFGNCLRDSGCSSVKVVREFEGQYLWADGVVSSHDLKADTNESAPIPAPDMIAIIEKTIGQVASQTGNRKLVIWGMATKGVMFALHAEQHGLDVFCGIDINDNKQGRYAPASGLRIAAPDELASRDAYAVVCMNPNYANEIRAYLEKRHLDFVLIEP